KVLIVKNCVDLGGSAEIAAFAEQDKNSWMSPFVVTSEDFLSIDEAAAYGPRKEDGSLPDIDYMHLAAGSDLIDAGVDVGLPYKGLLPDLGCFETGISAMHDHSFSMEVLCYPNPLENIGSIYFTLPEGGRCVIRLYDVSGRFVKTLTDLNVNAGGQHVAVDVSDVRAGIYFLRITLNKKDMMVSKLVKTN
ncbi:MAG TPA: T9SS type A sorting domain-containing protein, partial [Bacteroidales bacterium]|nr:T9SS type A sorting domain-containing protein [Bacteroidales bacterium]